MASIAAKSSAGSCPVLIFNVPKPCAATFCSASRAMSAGFCRVTVQDIGTAGAPPQSRQSGRPAACARRSQHATSIIDLARRCSGMRFRILPSPASSAASSSLEPRRENVFDHDGKRAQCRAGPIGFHRPFGDAAHAALGDDFDQQVVGAAFRMAGPADFARIGDADRMRDDLADDQRHAAHRAPAFFNSPMARLTKAGSLL